MKQIFHPYWLWEDYQSGMYEKPQDAAKEVRDSASLLSNPGGFDSCCGVMIATWVISAAVNLTNIHTNRRAWIGQAACCFNHGAVERSVREAWKGLTCEERTKANRIANEWITKYERGSGSLCNQMEENGVFRWNT